MKRLARRVVAGVITDIKFLFGKRGLTGQIAHHPKFWTEGECITYLTSKPARSGVDVAALTTIVIGLICEWVDQLCVRFQRGIDESIPIRLASRRLSMVSLCILTERAVPLHLVVA